jgi:uncharacterized protein (TIGR02391 family)
MLGWHLNEYTARQHVVDLTVGSRLVSHVLYTVALELGIRQFQVVVKRRNTGATSLSPSAAGCADYQLVKLPALKVTNGVFPNPALLPLEARTHVDSELALRSSALLDAGYYDEAVVNAFKVLDHRIRAACAEAPDVYGEELINRAFAPDKGKLSQGLVESERRGLRNLVSGANAFFRNPSAHRFVNYDQATAETVIVLVSLLLKMMETSSESQGQ